METEKTRIRFAKSQETGEIIGFVTRLPKSRMLKGVDENYEFGKKICVLSEDLKGAIQPNVIYDVELRPMHSRNGFIVISASRPKYEARFETIIIPKAVYQINIIFGHKIIYFDPKDGKSLSSRTIAGVEKALTDRDDLANTDEIIAEFRVRANALLKKLEQDGYIVNR